jgi:hypothetical protein
VRGRLFFRSDTDIISNLSSDPQQKPLRTYFNNQSKLTEYRPCTGEEEERWERKCQLSNDDDDDDGDEACRLIVMYIHQ